MVSDKRRKICVVTGTRAEYGLLYWLMKEIQADAELELQIIVTGMHLSPEFGLTYSVIEKDGFSIGAKVEMLLSSDTPVGIAKSIGLGVIGFADVLDRLQPDIMVLLGDRFEILAAAQAALVARIPVAHIHGGEATEGLIDEVIRHSITKMAHLHFVAAEPYRQRVIQMGEQPNKVFNFGAIGLDNIKRLPLLSREKLEESIGFSLGKLNFLVTYHPVTLDKTGAVDALSALFEVLDCFPSAHIIFTKPNADTGGRIIGQMIDEYVALYNQRMTVQTSLGQIRYLSAIANVDVVIGNSSSGLIEVPAFHKPTVNIGNRQAGRLMATSVITCGESFFDIKNALTQALSPEFQENLRNVISPYGTTSHNTSSQIKSILKTINLADLLIKRFNDLSE